MGVTFDLRNKNGAIKFIEDWLGVDEKSIMDYITQSKSGIIVNDFIENYNIELESKSIKNIKYIASHVTTAIDDLRHIKSHGLVDLATLLSLESPLRKYLEAYDIEIDIKNKQVSYKGITYNIDYYRKDKEEFIELDSIEGFIDSIAHKICFDNQISAFFTMEGDKAYTTKIHLRPEILVNMSNFCSKDLENPWANKAKGYVIEYEEDFDSFAWFTFYTKEEDYLNDRQSRNMHKSWLIEKALWLLWNLYFGDNYYETFAYMKADYVIPWSNVISCRSIN